MQELLSLLGAGADAAMIGLLYVCWRFDRRLYRIELHLFDDKKDGKKK